MAEEQRTTRGIKGQGSDREKEGERANNNTRTVKY